MATASLLLLLLLRSPTVWHMMAADPSERAAQIIEQAQRIAVLTGAGISTDSGIPDFRGSKGLWTLNPEAEKASDIRNYVSDPALRRRNWASRARGELWADAVPNPGHYALAGLEKLGKLHTLITQNVDELHQLAGSSPELVVEIHGTTRKAACLDCGRRDEMEAVLERVRAGDDDPHCDLCGGLLKSATISFGQPLVAEDLQRAERAAAECDAFLAVGTSLTVFPVCGTVDIARRSGAAIVILNLEPTPFDSIADVVLRHSISEALPRIVGIVD